MDNKKYSPLQLRELFHIEFLRWFSRKAKPEYYAVKGGTNLRLFFKSFRYSEDMDLDAAGIGVDKLKDIVTSILLSQSFSNTLKPFGIEDVLCQDMAKAKQIKTTQRFKIHLMTYPGEDLFTKVEFSRRGFKGNIIVQSVPDSVLRPYKLAPIVVSHYDAESAAAQKVDALASRAMIQARDIFDLFILSSQLEPSKINRALIDKAKLAKAYDNIFEVSFKQFQDTVISYLTGEDQSLYDSSKVWDDIKLKAANFIEELRG